jgi:hypothetical protein
MFSYSRTLRYRMFLSAFALLCLLSAITGYFTPVQAQTASPEFKFAVRQYMLSERIPRQTVTVTRSGATDSDVSILYSVGSTRLVAPGCTYPDPQNAKFAIPGADFTEARGTLRFAAGETSKTFDVGIINDEARELSPEIAFISLDYSESTTTVAGKCYGDSVELGIIDDDDYEPSAALSGRITATNGSPMPDAVVMVFFVGQCTPTSMATQTDANGDYRLFYAPGRCYTLVRPSKAGIIFSPGERAFEVLVNQRADFFGATTAHTVSGQIKDGLGGNIAGTVRVTVQSSTGESRSMIAGDGGRFAFTGLLGGANYKVTASSQHDMYLLAESNPEVANLNANREINFVQAAQVTALIGGGVAARTGVEIRTTSTDPTKPITCPLWTSDRDGYMTQCFVAIGGTYTLTPSKPLYTFNPPSIKLENVTPSGIGFQIIRLAFNPTPQITPEIRTWTMQGATQAYVKLTFPDNGYSVTDWGQITRTGNDLTVTAKIEPAQLAPVGEQASTAHIYDLGALPTGSYNFTFNSNLTTAQTKSLTVTNDPPTANPLDEARQFARQHYVDFLAREPDAPGLDFWTNEIASCNGDARCVDGKRVNVSASFFLSQEFQATGYYVYRLYKGGLGRAPYFTEFVKDVRAVAAGIVVDNRLSPEVIDRNKLEFARQFVQRDEFSGKFGKYHVSMTSDDFLNRLFETTGIIPNADERAALLSELNATTGTLAARRADALYKIVDGSVSQQNGIEVKPVFNTRYGKLFYDAEYDRAFVQMQYFGYLRRDPDRAGYDFWLAKLTRIGNFTDAEMVRSFVLAAEYRARFGQP